MTRIEIHLTEKETELLDDIAESEGRSRKNYCETIIRNIILKKINDNNKTVWAVRAVRQKKKKNGI